MAVAIGNAVGSSDMRFVAGVFAAIPLAVIFVKLKTNIWVLLPIGWYLTGRLPWLPLPFTVRDLCFMAAIFFFALFFATRTLPWKRKLSALDYLIYINLAYLLTVYVRNPAGFWAMQTSMVGGRPYFEIALTFGAFMVLSRVNLSDTVARTFPLFFVIPAWGVALLDAVARFVPMLAAPLNAAYSGIGSAGTQSAVGAIEREAGLGTTRLGGMQNAGLSSITALCARYNPVTLVSPLYPWRLFMLCCAIGAIFLSGFRSVLLFAMAAFLLGALLRRRLADLWLSAAVGVLAIFVLMSVQSVVPLPPTMQRALSWLPGDWNEEIVEDAQWSSRWRFEMWAWAWNDDRILPDRVWGQGFGLSLDDMNIIAQSLLYQGSTGFIGGSDREGTMLLGSFHNGPLSTIKFIGIVGLALYYPLMCYMAVVAWRLCKRAIGTKAFTLALFVGIPIIYEPFNFVFVFGGLDSNYPQLLFWAGLLNMTQRYVDTLRPTSARNTVERQNTSKRLVDELQPVLRRSPLAS